MAIEKEIWRERIEHNLYASNEFLRTMRIADEVNVLGNKVVHMPFAGAASDVQRNRSTLPAAVSRRTDTDRTYYIDRYSIDPVAVSDLETVEISYDKVDSVITQNYANLLEFVGSDIIYKQTASASITTPAGGAGSFGYEDIKLMTQKFSEAKIPMANRCAILTPAQTKALKDSLDEKYFKLDVADYKKGVVAKIDGWTIIERPYVVSTGDGVATQAPEEYSAGDVMAGMFYQKDTVEYALGDISLFHNTGRAEYYGDVLSGYVGAGATYVRDTGIALISE